jgi:hypothetical protein
MHRWSMLLSVLAAVPALPLVAQDTLPPLKTGTRYVFARPATRAGCDSLGVGPILYNTLPQADRTIEPPRILRAGLLAIPDGLVGVDARVLLSLVIDSTGHIAPCSVRVVTASDARFVAAATQTLERMVFAPGQQDGHPINSYIRLPIIWEHR